MSAGLGRVTKHATLASTQEAPLARSVSRCYLAQPHAQSDNGPSSLSESAWKVLQTVDGMQSRRACPPRAGAQVARRRPLHPSGVQGSHPHYQGFDDTVALSTSKGRTSQAPPSQCLILRRNAPGGVSGPILRAQHERVGPLVLWPRSACHDVGSGGSHRRHVPPNSFSPVFRELFPSFGSRIARGRRPRCCASGEAVP